MWSMIAEPGLRCAEYCHGIQPIRLYLLELPKEIPLGGRLVIGATLGVSTQGSIEI